MGAAVNEPMGPLTRLLAAVFVPFVLVWEIGGALLHRIGLAMRAARRAVADARRAVRVAARSALATARSATARLR